MFSGLNICALDIFCIFVNDLQKIEEKIGRVKPPKRLKKLFYKPYKKYRQFCADYAKMAGGFKKKQYLA